jgi:hypothetical protein
MEDCDDMNIMNNSDNKEEEHIAYEESQLYYPSGIKNKEMWQFIRYVAPSNEKKKWKMTTELLYIVQNVKGLLNVKCKWNNKAHEKQAHEFDK